MTESISNGRCSLPNYDAPFLTQDGEVEGKVVGYRDCTMEGCRSQRIGVRWPDGTLTWPCSKGCWVTENGTWRII